MYNYKGIFYKEEKEKKYYEGGAHFKYSDLVNELIELIKQNHEKLEYENSKIPSENLICSLNNQNEEKDLQKIIKESKITNSNLLTINNNKIKNNIKTIKPQKYILSTEKNIDEEKAKKKRLIELLNYNIKIPPFQNNFNNCKKIFSNSNNSLDKKYIKTEIKTIGNNDSLSESKHYLNMHINYKNLENNNQNLPLIQSSYFNNVSNKNTLERGKNNIKKNILNFKHASKYTLNKTKISKDNLFLKNKMFSPDKNLNFKRNNAFSKDISEINKNQKKYDTINILTKKNRNFIGGKLSKYLNNMNKQKKNLNIKLLNFEYNKKEQ